MMIFPAGWTTSEDLEYQAWQKRHSKDIDQTLGQLAIDLLALKPKNNSYVQREAIADAIELLDQMMDRLEEAGLAK
jgi:hypothetical protein